MRVAADEPVRRTLTSKHMHTFNYKALAFLSSFAAALAMLPASARASGACEQSATRDCRAGGRAQVSRERSVTTQMAESDAEAEQDAIDAQMPTNGSDRGSPSSSQRGRANRHASNSANSSAGNEAQTKQSNSQAQGRPARRCAFDCDNGRATQVSFQESATTQKAEAEAQAGDTGEPGASNAATADAANNGETEQDDYQLQRTADSSCSHGCNGGGQAQRSRQSSTTVQVAESDAEARQDVRGASLPVAGAAPGSDGDDRFEPAWNTAESSASNEAQTSQSNTQAQAGQSACVSACNPGGEAQLSFEQSATIQWAESQARAEQSSIHGNQTDAATSEVSDAAATRQSNDQSQAALDTSCMLVCDSDGQAQVSSQSSTTIQRVGSDAEGTEETVDVASSGGGEGRGSSAGAVPGNPAAEANATTQLIWQVQLSECVAHCSGTTQSQAAEQQNLTVQTQSEASQNAGSGAAQAARSEAQAGPGLTQLQLGCIADCFGAAATPAAPTLASYAQAVEEVLRVLREVGAGLSTRAAAGEQTSVEQVSYQVQLDSAGESSQSASQASTTVQVYEASSLMADVEKALELSVAAKDEAVNQTDQGIWQLQIGCLMFCEETELYQLAAQSSSSAQDGSSQTASTVTQPSENTTTQLVWQAQIGCLFWCVDATEQQSAPAQGTPATREAATTKAGDESPLRALGEAPAPPSGPASSLGATGELGYVLQLVQELLAPKAAPAGTGSEQQSPAPAAPAGTPNGAGVTPSASDEIPVSAASAPASVLAPALQESVALPVGSAGGAVRRRARASGPHHPAPDARARPAVPQFSGQPQLATPPSDGPRAHAAVSALARVQRAVRTGLSDTASVIGTLHTSEASHATLLSGFAVWGLCIFGIALAAARWDSRARKPEAGG